MKRALLILVLMNFACVGNAQSTFFSFYDTIPGTAFGNEFTCQVITRCQDGTFVGLASYPGQHLIFRFDDSGNMIWWRKIIYPASVIPIDITSLSDSSFAIVFQAYAPHNYIIISKIDLGGNNIWSKSILNIQGSSPSSIAENGYGGIFITAYSLNQKNTLIFFDSNGNITSQKAHTTSLNDTVHVMESVADGINQFVCVGFNPNNGNYSFFRSDSTGTIYNFNEIAIPYGLGLGYGVGAEFLSTAPDGSHYCVLPTYDTIQAFVLIKFNAADQIEWSKFIYSLDSACWGRCVLATPDNGCIVIAGNTYSFTPVRYLPSIMKFDENGNVDWSNAPGDTSVASWEAIGVDAILPASNNSWMMTVPRYYSFSLFKSDSLFNGFCYNSTNHLNIVNFAGSLNPDSVYNTPSSFYTDTITPVVSPPIPIYRTDVCISVGLLDDIVQNDHINIFPNPFHNELNISSVGNPGNKIIIFDIATRKVLEENISSEVTLNTKKLSEGIYIYEIRNKNEIVKSGRIVKQ